jgi:hypothetical protein
VIPWRDLIDFEENAPEGRRSKAQAIRATFHISTGRYYWELLRAIDRPEAAKYAPATVAALQRIRETGRLRRALGGDAA